MQAVKEQQRQIRKAETERDSREIESRLARVRAQISVLASTSHVPMMRRASD